MGQSRRHLFTLHELLIMAALAALGGATSAAVSNVRAALQAVIPVPGSLQILAGVHILWLVLAVGLLRKPGAATITGLLKAPVELLSANQLGFLVFAFCLLAGVTIDLVWLLMRRRHRPLTYAVAGGLGAASNILAAPFMASVSYSEGAVLAVLAIKIPLALASGVVFGGLLGWSLLVALDRAGVTRPAPGSSIRRNNESPPTTPGKDHPSSESHAATGSLE